MKTTSRSLVLALVACGAIVSLAQTSHAHGPKGGMGP